MVDELICDFNSREYTVIKFSDKDLGEWKEGYIPEVWRDAKFVYQSSRN